MKQYQVRLDKADYLWLLDRVESMVARAKSNISVWCDMLPQIERVRDAVAAGEIVILEGEPEAEPEPVKVRKKPGERMATLPKLCPDHPAYGALRSPRTDCDDCWNAYERGQGVLQTKKARDILRRKLGKGGVT